MYGKPRKGVSRAIAAHLWKRNPKRARWLFLVFGYLLPVGLSSRAQAHPFTTYSVESDPARVTGRPSLPTGPPTTEPRKARGSIRAPAPPPSDFGSQARAGYSGEARAVTPASLGGGPLPSLWPQGTRAALSLGALAVLLALVARMAFLEWQRRQLKREMALRSLQLRLAKETAEEAIQAKSHFLANLTHELKTPLAGVLGMVYLLERSELSPVQAQYSTTIRKSGESLLVVINDLLDFSRLEASDIELQLEPVEISPLFDDLCAAVAPVVADKRLQLDCYIDPTVPDWISGDATRLRQILLNLVGNAVKFTDQGRVEIRVQALGNTDTDLKLEIAVIDTGIGIPEDRVFRVFDPFFQVDPTLSRRHGGNGLGLTISSHLAHRMGGNLRVDSTLGQGTTFTFTFPITAVSQRPRDPEFQR